MWLSEIFEDWLYQGQSARATFCTCSELLEKVLIMVRAFSDLSALVQASLTHSLARLASLPPTAFRRDSAWVYTWVFAMCFLLPFHTHTYIYICPSPHLPALCKDFISCIFACLYKSGCLKEQSGQIWQKIPISSVNFIFFVKLI